MHASVVCFNIHVKKQEKKLNRVVYSIKSQTTIKLKFQSQTLHVDILLSGKKKSVECTTNNINIVRLNIFIRV
jgi:hypothetical protein